MRTLWLTIDDGPVADQAARLDLLDRHGIKAVWFCLGANLSKYREQACETLRRGHLLANHSWDHPGFSKISFDESKRQILTTHEVLTEIYQEVGLPFTPRLFRFPYVDEGTHRTEVGEYLQSLGYRPGRWDGLDQAWWFAEGRDQHAWTHATFDTQDWGTGQPEGSKDHRTTDEIVPRLREHLALGRHEILVAHAWVPLATLNAMVECLTQEQATFPLPEG